MSFDDLIFSASYVFGAGLCGYGAYLIMRWVDATDRPSEVPTHIGVAFAGFSVFPVINVFLGVIGVLYIKPRMNKDIERARRSREMEREHIAAISAMVKRNIWTAAAIRNGGGE